MPRKEYFARRPMKYNRRELDRGQVFSLTGAPNDEALVRLGYAQPVERGTEYHVCAECGARFVGVTQRTEHGDKRHNPALEDLSPEQADRLAEREERRLNQVAPLYLDKTVASQQA